MAAANPAFLSLTLFSSRSHRRSSLREQQRLDRSRQRLDRMTRRILALRRKQARRRQQLMLIVMALLPLLPASIPRDTWSVPRSDQWWSYIVLRTFTDRDWLDNFRMSKNTFLYLCTQLSPSLRRSDTVMRRSVSVERRVAITLWCLATPTEYRTIGHLFGVARSTVCEIVHETCGAIVRILQRQYIKFPTGAELDAIVDGFNTKWGVPQCVGAIDGSHIPISAPLLNHTDYYNRKGWYSMVLQGLVDHNYRFLDVYAGWPGSVHDARVFAHSSLYTGLSQGTLLPSYKTTTISGVSVPLFIIGDSAYPLETWLMKPFSQAAAVSSQHRTYNYSISRARIVVENAFGRLKARWRRLLKRNDMHTDKIPTIITATCILHNLCEIHGEGFNEMWIQEAEAVSALQQPNTVNHPLGTSNRPKEIRDAL